jgi:predicted transcriptional regulator
MKTLKKKIKDTLRRRPYWSAVRVAEHLGVSQNVVSVTASRAKIKFMSRREVEDWIDGKA